MRRVIVATALLLGLGHGAGAAQFIYESVRTHAGSGVDVSTAADYCDRTIGVQHDHVSAAYNRCMLRHGWRFSHSAPSQRSTPTYDYDIPAPPPPPQPPSPQVNPLVDPITGLGPPPN
jgi:hypothetical protein